MLELKNGREILILETQWNLNLFTWNLYFYKLIYQRKYVFCLPTWVASLFLSYDEGEAQEFKLWI